MDSKKKNILIIILSILLLILGGYLIYDKFLSNQDITNNNENNNYKNFKYLNDAKNNKQYIVKINGNKYEVVYDLGEDTHYIGIYNGKFYYSDTRIKYIDLNNENLSEEVLLKIPQSSENPPAYQARYISDSAIIGDTLYFNLNMFSGGKEKYDGILSINLNSNTFDDHKQVIADAELGKWYTSEDNSKIYYAKFNSNKGIIPYEYDIKTGTHTQLSEKEYIYDIMYENGKLLYYTREADRYDTNRNKIYSCNCTPHYELYIYDTKDKTTDLITKEIYDNKNGCFSDIADMIDGKIYYYTSDGIIHQYNYETKKSSDYYVVPNNSIYRGFNFIDKDTMKISFEEEIKQFVINGKNVDSINEIEITMLDNSVETYTIENLK